MKFPFSTAENCPLVPFCYLTIGKLIGRFDTRVKSINLESGTPLAITGERLSIDAWEAHYDNPSPHITTRAHGIIMLLVFLIVFPFGILGILFGRKRAFLLHSGAQTLSTVLILLAALLAAWTSSDLIQVIVPFQLLHYISMTNRSVHYLEPSPYSSPDNWCCNCHPGPHPGKNWIRPP